MKARKNVRKVQSYVQTGGQIISFAYYHSFQRELGALGITMLNYF